MKCPECKFENPEDARFCSQCGKPLIHMEKITSSAKTSPKPMTELTIGSTFVGRYQIIEILDKAGMGKVYGAFDKKTNTKIALKVLKSAMASTSQTIDHYRNELKLTQRISHKNICSIYDLNKEENTLFITMKYISGDNLKNILAQKGSLPTGNAIIIAKQLCEGLHEAHGFGIVHKNLKPRNIMIDKDGNVRIMDLGISRSIKAKGVTRTGVMIGTPVYMSPEQAAEEEVDIRSDIYSLGVILFEMATGDVPFKGKTALNVAMKHRTEQPPDPRSINTEISKDLSAVILKCLKKNKDRRYQNAKELLSDLINIEQGIPIKDRGHPKVKTQYLRSKLKNLLSFKK